MINLLNIMLLQRSLEIFEKCKKRFYLFDLNFIEKSTMNFIKNIIKLLIIIFILLRNKPLEMIRTLRWCLY